MRHKTKKIAKKNGLGLFEVVSAGSRLPSSGEISPAIVSPRLTTPDIPSACSSRFAATSALVRQIADMEVKTHTERARGHVPATPTAENPGGEESDASPLAKELFPKAVMSADEFEQKTETPVCADELDQKM